MLKIHTNKLHAVCFVMPSYQELIKQRKFLQSLSQDGIKVARDRIDSINLEINKLKNNPFIFDPTFIHQKEGFHRKLLASINYQASRGSQVCIIEMQKYADWVISNMALSR